MTLPVNAKTWQLSANNTITAGASAAATSKATMRAMKNLLKGFASNAWTVVGSSNSVAAALDASDRWAADSDLVWANAGSAHSWIVLKQAQLSSNFQVCIDLNAAAVESSATVAVSANAGFTGGTTTARPTATDEHVPVSATNWGSSSGNVTNILHAWQSTDGQCTRLAITRAGGIAMVAILDKPANPATGWSNPHIVMWKATNSTTPNAGGSTAGVDAATLRVTSAGSEVLWGRGSANLRAVLSWEGDTNHVQVLGVANELSSDWAMLPCGIYVPNTASNRGRHGNMFDLWIGQTTIATADTYPSDATLQYTQLGGFILPWGNATAMVMT